MIDVPDIEASCSDDALCVKHTHAAVSVVVDWGSVKHMGVWCLQADRWYRQLLRSHEMMQQLVGGADPASPLEVDWDTASVTSTEQAEDEKTSGTQSLACLGTPWLENVQGVKSLLSCQHLRCCRACQTQQAMH